MVCSAVAARPYIMIGIVCCELSTVVIRHRIVPRISSIFIDIQRVVGRRAADLEAVVLREIPYSVRALEIESNLAVSLRHFVQPVQSNPILWRRASKPLLEWSPRAIEESGIWTCSVNPENQYRIRCRKNIKKSISLFNNYGLCRLIMCTSIQSISF